MASLTPKTFAKAYLIITLLMATLIAPIPHSIIALILLATQLYSAYKPPQARTKLILITATLVLTPLSLEPLTGNLLSALLIIPALYLIDQNLQENASNQPLKHTKKGIKTTHTLEALTTTLLLLLTTSAILLNQTLMLTTLILISYLGIIITYILRKIPKTPIETSKTLSSIIVGETEKNTTTLKGKAQLPIHLSLKTTLPWVRVEPTELILPPKGEAKISLTMTPPLAGPSKLELTTLAIDPWGLIQVNQSVEPVNLHIIPRAKYAQWLARKYLEQTASGISTIAEIPQIRALRAAKRGIEFYGTRAYSPGDRLKDVDWKHVSKLQELIVKEYVGAHGQTTIIAANLDAKDAEAADRLSYNFVVSALTLATEAVPTALAIYNQNQVIAITAPTNPRETLKKTLQLIQNITIVEQPKKTLQPIQTQKLKRSIDQLEQTKTETAQKLAQLLQIEYQTTQKTAKTHPATQAIEKAAQNAPAPAMITIISPMNHDAEALNITLQKLKNKGYNIIQI